MKRLLMALLLVSLGTALPLLASKGSGLPVPTVTPCDPGTGGGGSTCVTSCAVQCSNGYWSSIGCLATQCAHCPCDGDIPTPYCSNP